MLVKFKLYFLKKLTINQNQDFKINRFLSQPAHPFREIGLFIKKKKSRNQLHCVSLPHTEVLMMNFRCRCRDWSIRVCASKLRHWKRSISHPLVERSLFLLVNQRFSKSLQHFSLVVFEVTVDVVYRPVFHHPQLALSLSNQPGIVAHDDHS